MAATSLCAYDAACETPCHDGAAARVVELTADADRRRLLAALEDLAGNWLSTDAFVRHVNALFPDLGGGAAGTADLVRRTFPGLEAAGLLATDAPVERFVYHGCPLVADLVAAGAR